MTGASGNNPYGLDIRNSTFVNNVSSSGGAIMVTDDSAAIHLSASNFTSNVAATGGGGAIWTVGRVVNVVDSLFTGNVADGTSDGGAISALGSATVISVTGGSSFSGNRSLGGEGGAIWTVGRSLAIGGANFANNTAGGDGGGAIYVPTGASTSVSLDDSSTFTGNQAPSGSGGAIRTAGASLTVSEASFATNTSSVAGGAISVPAGSGTTIVVNTGTTFTSNSSTSGSGGAINSGGSSMTLTGASFVSNAAGGGGSAGGAVWTTGSLATSATSFASNSVTSSGGGGAIWTAGTATIGPETSFDSNSATTGDGGALSSVGPTLNLTGASFTNNSSAGSNGGGAVWAAGSSLTSSTTTYSDNTTVSDGGAVWAAGTLVSSTGDTFARNAATHDGGAISAVSGSVVATNATFFRNSAVVTGGAILADDTVTLRFVTSSDDSSSSGAVFSSRTGPISMPGTAVSPAISGGVACNTAADASSNDSYVADTSCGSGDDTVTVTTRALLGFDDTLVADDSTGALVLIPDDTSILVNAAPANLVSGVTQDQLQAVRGRAPVTTTSVGAVQVLPILITTQPSSTSVSAGNSATFTVAGLPGVGTSVDYQWQTSSDGGVTWVNRAGATSPVLTLNSVAAGQDGLRVRARVSDLREEPMNSATATLTVITPGPGPGPAPAAPASAPQNVTATAENAEATVTWSAPASSGSFPITTYEVRSTPTGGTCLVSARTCTITGLTNGTTYTFEARALNGAGWGPWSTPSNAVTPVAPPPPSITITGSRGTGADRRIVSVTGTSTGLDAQQVRAHVKLRGHTNYRPGRFVDVLADGTFTWQRTTGKKTYIYFTGSGAQSNRIIIQAARR